MQSHVVKISLMAPGVEKKMPLLLTIAYHSAYKQIYTGSNTGPESLSRMFAQTICIPDMAVCLQLCEVFQQDLNTSKQMFEK